MRYGLVDQIKFYSNYPKVDRDGKALVEEYNGTVIYDYGISDPELKIRADMVAMVFPYLYLDSELLVESINSLLNKKDLAVYNDSTRQLFEQLVPEWERIKVEVTQYIDSHVEAIRSNYTISSIHDHLDALRDNILESVVGFIDKNSHINSEISSSLVYLARTYINSKGFIPARSETQLYKRILNTTNSLKDLSAERDRESVSFVIDNIGFITNNYEHSFLNHKKSAIYTGEELIILKPTFFDGFSDFDRVHKILREISNNGKLSVIGATKYTSSLTKLHFS